MRKRGKENGVDVDDVEGAMQTTAPSQTPLYLFGRTENT